MGNFHMGSALNQRLGILFGGAGMLLGIGGAVSDGALGGTLWILAGIVWGFTLMFLVLWAISRRMEGKLQASCMEQHIPAEDVDAVCMTFQIPAEELRRNLRARMEKILKWTALFGAGLAGIWLLMIAVTEHFGGMESMCTALGIAFAFPLIAFLSQYPPYRQYGQRMIGRIQLAAEGITVDGRVFPKESILRVAISSEKRHNSHAIAMYRSLQIKMDKGNTRYWIDFRGEGNTGLQYEAYPALLAACESWCRKNSIAFDIIYTD